MRGSNFTYLFRQGISSVWHNRMMSFASFCILMVSLLMVGLSALLVMDIGLVIGNIEEKNEVLVYVDKGISQTDLSHITDVIGSNQYVESVVFYSKEQAFEDKKAEMPDFATLFEYLDENPMPNTFRVKINDLTKMNIAVEQFGVIDGVIKVNAPYDFASFLTSLRTTFSLIGSAVLIALIAVSLIIVYNTSRTSVYSRRKEINIMKYVGATNAFIKLPFFVEGMFIGVISGLASWILTKIAYESVISLFSGDATIWSVLGLTNVINFDDISLYVLLANCVVGALLGALGTVMSMGKHLRV